MNKVAISPAGPEEKEAVRRVSRACYEDDYVLVVLDHMLQSGTLLLARIAQEAAGFVYFDLALDGSLWLSSLRVVPSRRGQGIGAALCRAGEALAREAGSDAIRLWTAESNAPARTLFEGLGYRHVTDFTRWWMQVGPETSESPPDALNSLGGWSAIGQSSVLQASKGFLPFDLKFCRFGADLKGRLESSGWLYADARRVPIVLNPDIWNEFKSQTVELTVLGDEVEASVKAAAGYASEASLEAVGTFLPYGVSWAETARRAGLKMGTWGRHARLYVKQIPDSAS